MGITISRRAGPAQSESLVVVVVVSMAAVWRGTTIGAAGFRRPAALKRILPQFAADAEFVRMFAATSSAPGSFSGRR